MNPDLFRNNSIHFDNIAKRDKLPQNNNDGKEIFSFRSGIK